MQLLLLDKQFFTQSIADARIVVAVKVMARTQRKDVIAKVDNRTGHGDIAPLRAIAAKTGKACDERGDNARMVRENSETPGTVFRNKCSHPVDLISVSRILEP